MTAPANGAEPLRILGLQIDNFKRLIAVELRPDGKSVVIGGRNAQGKTSLLDAIATALGGAKRAPEMPLRTGAKRGKVRVDLGEYIVTRTWTEGSDRLTVEDHDGRAFKSPQALLDKLAGDLSFDPLAFSRMDERERAATLRRLVGVDTRELDAEAARVFEDRTAVNRDVKRLDALLADIPAAVPLPPIGESVSLAELTAEHRAAVEEARDNERARENVGKMRRAVEDVAERLRRLDREIARLNEERVGTLETHLELERAADAADRDAAALVDPDVDAIALRIDGAEQHNAGVRARQVEHERAAEVERRRATTTQERDKVRAASEAATARLAAIADEKAAALAAARFPVPGLSIDGDAVTFNGVPFAQASSAEQVRVGLAIGAALNPRLRVVLVRDGSLLDEDTFASMLRWADEAGLQVWVETVGDRGVGVLIEDGRVWEDGTETTSAPGVTS